MEAIVWQRIKEIVLLAEAIPPHEWATKLPALCGHDPGLIKQVKSYLITQPKELPKPCFDLPTWPPGYLVADYRILSSLGSGGMGQVYLAEQTGDPHRKVALKVIASVLASPEAKRRFMDERYILAALEHDHITRIYDAGVCPEQRPFFTMEFVQGTPIDTFCDQNRLSIRERLVLFLPVCDAVYHAHQHLIVHRDLKPMNVLVNDKRMAKLIDFGIAEMLRRPAHLVAEETASQHRILTPLYASPEQVRGQTPSTAIDIYGLGMLLYQLLCGQYPYPKGLGSQCDLERAILEDEPEPPSLAIFRSGKDLPTREDDGVSPARGIAEKRATSLSQLAQVLAGDMDLILARALAKNPRQRYGSAQALAADLQRFLQGHRCRGARFPGIIERINLSNATSGRWVPVSCSWPRSPGSHCLASGAEPGAAYPRRTGIIEPLKKRMNS